MSSYKVVLKPGGVGGRNVGVGIKLAKKSLLSPAEIAALSAVVPVSTSLDVTVIYPVGMIGASVQITGPDAFDQTIVNTMMFDSITAGDYTIVAAPVTGHTARVFSSPITVADQKKVCSLVLYDVTGTGGGGDAVVVLDYSEEVAQAMRDGHYKLSVLVRDKTTNEFLFTLLAFDTFSPSNSYAFGQDTASYNYFLRYGSTDGTLTIPLNMLNEEYPIQGTSGQTTHFVIA